MIDPRFLREPQRFNSIEASIAESSDLKVCSVFMGLDHAKGDQNRRATMGTGSVGFNYATLAAACGRGCVKQGIAGESFQAFRGIGKALVFQGFGCADSVRVVGFGFHDLYGHQLPAEPTGCPMDSPENSGLGFDEMSFSFSLLLFLNLIRAAGVNPKSDPMLLARSKLSLLILEIR